MMNLPVTSRLPFGVTFFMIALACVFSIADEPSPPASSIEPRWWKGNLHTHSLWSDGDEFPEMIADWYREQEYNFLALTDHNLLSKGMRWMPLADIVKRSNAGIMDRYEARFGKQWVEKQLDDQGNVQSVRLKPLDEFRCLVEEREKFILIPAEEISDTAVGKPLHMNATNLAEAIKPAGGKTVQEVIQNNLRAVLEHGKEHGREVLPHLNHPNFYYAVTAEDMAAVIAEQFFEVYNGHPGVNHLGDKSHPSVEQLWDVANAIRLRELHSAPLLGIATDDSHEYHGEPGSHPGRGWVMVRSQYLTPQYLIQAMKRGEFYASSGVSLKSMIYDESAKTLTVEVDPVEGAEYRIDFITSANLPFAENDQIGKVVSSEKGTKASYQMTGTELYVRAVVTSNQPPVDPAFKDQLQQAWTQPVGWILATDQHAPDHNHQPLNTK